MNFYELTYIVEDEQQERLSGLARRFEKINGWDEKAMLQFAVNADSDIERKLLFLEKMLLGLEREGKV